MLKFLLILLLSSACILNASASKLGLKTSKGEPLELLELKTKALVEGPYAEVQYIQTYKNPLNHTVETEFHFPRTENSIFHKFEAVFQNQTIVGRVLEKEAAKKMYEWNTKKGNTVAYSERNQVAPDVMNIKVGNIPANETVEIIFSVLQPLETVVNKFYELRLPVVLTERYNPSSFDVNKIPHIQTVDSNNSLYKDWHIQVEIKSNTPFAILSNPTHNLEPELSEKQSGYISKIYKAVWNATVTPNKDFVVYFGPEKLEKPETVLATYPQEPNNHVLLVNFIPDLNTIQPSVVRDLLFKTNSEGILRLKRMAYEYDLENAQAEFIFVIDRSGSMMGSRMENLRRALKKFLNAIPKASYFNIISFGSNYQLYKPQSVRNSPEALEEVLKWVFVLQPDMGGTEILGALRALTDGEGTNLPKIVMILTDGDVFNADEVIKHISNNANKMRFCSVGIGAGASDYLVRNMAKAGKCRSEFVQDGEDIGDKALYMVQSAISQYVTDIKFAINCFNDENQKVYSEESELDLLMKDQPFNKWIYLENIPNLKSCQATLDYYNGLKGKRVTEEMEIQAYETEEITNFWHKIAYDAKIKELEQEIKMKRTWTKDENIQSHIVKLSIKYQILCDYTSFLAVLQESTVDPNETAQKIRIPNMDSADYFANPREVVPNYDSYYYQNGNRRYPKNPGSDEIIVGGGDYGAIDIGLDVVVMGMGDDYDYDFAPDVELEVGGCAEVDITPDVDDFKEGEEEGRDGNGNDEIVDQTQNPDTIPAGWSCENADDANTKECSQVENLEKQEEKEEPKEEVSNEKEIESSDLKLVNTTNHTIPTHLTEITNQSLHLNENSPQSGKAVSSVISDQKESEGLHKSEDKSSKILGLESIGISFLVILLSVILL